MTDQGLRYNNGKPQLSYLLSAPHANEALARVFEFGAGKYDRDNWLKGLPKHEVIDSLIRHLQAYMAGELDDPESGLSHTAHIHWNALALSEFEMRGEYRSRPLEALSDRAEAWTREQVAEYNKRLAKLKQK